MKTPREILLLKHRVSQPQLDRVRREIVSELSAPETGWLAALQVLFTPRRLVWGTFAAAWAIIFLLNFSASRLTPDAPVHMAGKPLPANASAVRERQRLYAELMGIAVETKERPASSRPHSARRPETFFA